MKTNNIMWISVKDKLPSEGIQVIRYSPNVNISQERMAVSICEGRMLKYADETVWWMLIPELPVPLNSK